MSRKESEQRQRRPFDDLVDVARAISQNPETVNYKAKQVALEKARELQQQGLFPDDDSKQPWTEEHDKRLHTLITDARKEHGLPYYPPGLQVRCNKLRSR